TIRITSARLWRCAKGKRYTPSPVASPPRTRKPGSKSGKQSSAPSGSDHERAEIMRNWKVFGCVVLLAAGGGAPPQADPRPTSKDGETPVRERFAELQSALKAGDIDKI